MFNKTIIFIFNICCQVYVYVCLYMSKCGSYIDKTFRFVYIYTYIYLYINPYTFSFCRLLRYIQEQDDNRVYYEGLQDKLTQMKDARAALDALREEHKEKLRRRAEEAERQRQMLMAQKLAIMRKKKQEYLQYQRQLALRKIQEQEREMQMRQEQQKQQYIMGNFMCILKLLDISESPLFSLRLYLLYLCRRLSSSFGFYGTFSRITCSSCPLFESWS